MNAPTPSQQEQDALNAAAAWFKTNAASLEQLRTAVEAELRRCNAVLVAAKLDRIMRQVRART